jgi:hypothetical protein
MAHQDERARIVARLAEIDEMVSVIDRMITVNRMVISSRNCKLHDRIESLRTAIHLLSGGPEQ